MHGAIIIVIVIIINIKIPPWEHSHGASWQDRPRSISEPSASHGPSLAPSYGTWFGSPITIRIAITITMSYSTSVSNCLIWSIFLFLQFWAATWRFELCAIFYSMSKSLQILNLKCEYKYKLNTNTIQKCPNLIISSPYIIDTNTNANTNTNTNLNLILSSPPDIPTEGKLLLSQFVLAQQVIELQKIWDRFFRY